MEGVGISRDSRTVTFGTSLCGERPSVVRHCCNLCTQNRRSHACHQPNLSRSLSRPLSKYPSFRNIFHNTAAKEISYYMLVPIDGRSPEILLERG